MEMILFETLDQGDPKSKSYQWPNKTSIERYLILNLVEFGLINSIKAAFD